MQYAPLVIRFIVADDTTVAGTAMTSQRTEATTPAGSEHHTVEDTDQGPVLRHFRGCSWCTPGFKAYGFIALIAVMVLPVPRA